MNDRRIVQHLHKDGPMLVLTREVGQTIRIGRDVEVTVVRMQNGKVRLGITAPKDVPVHREEYARELERAAVKP